MRVFRMTYTSKTSEMRTVSNHWLAFTDHFGRLHRFAGYTDKRASYCGYTT